MRALLAICVVLLALPSIVLAQDASVQERVWAGVVSRALGAPVADPARGEGRVSVTAGRVRVTRERAPDAAAALARARDRGATEGTLVVEVRGRQLVTVEARDGGDVASLARALEAGWDVLPGGDAARSGLVLRRPRATAAVARAAGALRDEAIVGRDVLRGRGARESGGVVALADARGAAAARVGARDAACADAPTTRALRELLDDLTRLDAGHGLGAALDLLDAPGTGAGGPARGEASEPAVSGRRAGRAERPDLTGVWSVHAPEDAAAEEDALGEDAAGKESFGASPDSVRFSNRRAGDPDVYDVVFVTADGDRRGEARFDGEALVVEVTEEPSPSPADAAAGRDPSSVGLSRALAAASEGRAADGPTRSARPSSATEAPRAAAPRPRPRPGRYTLDASARELNFTADGAPAAGVRAFRRFNQPAVTCPAEWEPTEEVLWAAADATRQFTLVGVYEAALRSTSGVRHRVFTGTRADALFLEEQLASRLGAEHLDALDALEVVVRPLDSVWIRDFGPITCRRTADGARVAADMGYYADRVNDDAVPVDYARARGWDVVDVTRLRLEGGNFMTDGRGRVFLTGRALEGALQGANDSQREVEDALFELGAREVVWLPRMTHADGTGHIDMFAKLIGPDAVLVGRDRGGPQEAMLDDAARRFTALGLRVERVDMARNPTVTGNDAIDLQTYTNSLFVGGVALVPQYDAPASDRAALEVYRRLGYTAVGADVRGLIQMGGAIHCVSMQVAR